MFRIIASQASRCLAQLYTRTETARFWFSSSVLRIVNSVSIDTLDIDGSLSTSKTSGILIKLSPSKTVPLWLPATPAFGSGSYHYPVASWVLGLAFVAFSLMILCGAVDKLGILEVFINTVKRLTSGLFNTIQVVAVTPLVYAGRILLWMCRPVVRVLERRTRRSRRVLKAILMLFVFVLGDYSLMVNSEDCNIVSFAVAHVCFLSLAAHAEPCLRASRFYGELAHDTTIRPLMQTLQEQIYRLKIVQRVRPLPAEVYEAAFSELASEIEAWQSQPQASQPPPQPPPDIRQGLWGSSMWKTMKSLRVKPKFDRAKLRETEELGQGGFGQVVRAEAGGRTMAVKKIRKRLRSHQHLFWAMFRNEVKVQLRMRDHPAFPELYGVFHDSQHFYLAMECGEVCLGDLDETLSREEIYFYGRQLCAGVQALHERGVVHLDLKPDNLLLGADGQLLIIDYGLAHIFAKPYNAKDYPIWDQLRKDRSGRFPMLWVDDGAQKDTRNPHVLQWGGGTPGYMSRLLLDGRRFSYGADLWGIGVILHEWLTGDREICFALHDDKKYLARYEHRLLPEEKEFFSKIFSVTRGKRFEDWKALNDHAFWSTTTSASKTN